MSDRRDPVERAAAASRDLYDVATWERRSVLDTLSTLIYALLVWGGKGVVVLLALGLLVVQFVAGGLLTAVQDPEFLALVVLSVVPALGLAAYVWYADATERQPVGALAMTFVLGVLFAMFAAIANGLLVGPLLSVSVLLFPVAFFLVVGPVEELVKLAAVRLFAYRTGAFASVVDGAVYGAVAGLGFATIENLLYISRSLGEAGEVAVLGATGGTAAVRALAGPGHVIYSAFAGYYLGLARFNPDDSGPIVVKGLLIAAFVHGLYNSLVTVVPGLLNAFVAPLGALVWFVAFIVVYDGLLGLVLYRKLDRYAGVLENVRSQDRADVDPELTEFDSPVGVGGRPTGREGTLAGRSPAEDTARREAGRGRNAERSDRRDPERSGQRDPERSDRRDPGRGDRQDPGRSGQRDPDTRRGGEQSDDRRR
jgi:RsiW-degrading membrane proteinase PrsW (M82 family)